MPHPRPCAQLPSSLPPVVIRLCVARLRVRILVIHVKAGSGVLGKTEASEALVLRPFTGDEDTGHPGNRPAGRWEACPPMPWLGVGKHGRVGPPARDSQGPRRPLPSPPRRANLPLLSSTYIIGLQIWVVLLNAIIQDGDHHPTASVALLPGLLHIQVSLVAVGLQERGAADPHPKSQGAEAEVQGLREPIFSFLRGNSPN